MNSKNWLNVKKPTKDFIFIFLTKGDLLKVIETAN